ncbi:ATP-binding protein [Novosphingobium sp. PC22D]|uniref:ATP-binding protein n=1 Tax=Novosphingobium sp. PC22D TaxID=1962403 RepID=UPI000BF05655|nr:ATP-binding protein [Novosphingobium sp. PC22D]PEQ13694.1 ATP-binding protein [Novosphingobium sp. PC22D]
MSAQIEIGQGPGGGSVAIDIEELLATRLLVQGNSGSGKSHLLRRLLEESAGMVQQIVIDPEGDFVTLADAFDHVVVDGAAYSGGEIARLAGRIRKHRASVVLALDNLEIEAQMRCAALFLSALFDAPREEWYPALVIVDEAQMFAPAVAGDVSDEVRRLSLGAMTNLMCRGRKRGLAGIVATQRLAKLAKNVAAEASNFLMGRTFLDIDMARAADLLGMERRNAEEIRDLDRGHFLGLGPAISRRPIPVRIGPVRTGSKAVSHAMEPPPSITGDELHALLHGEGGHSADEAAPAKPGPPARVSEQAAPLPPGPSPTPPFPAMPLSDGIATADVLIDRIAARAAVPAEAEAQPGRDAETEIADVLAEMAAEPDCAFRSAAVLYQDFAMRCRQRRIRTPALDIAQFRRRFALALAGVTSDDAGWGEILEAGSEVPEDLLAPYLLMARAAQRNAPCPEDEELGRVYGTSSPGRIRRLLEYLEKGGFIVVRTDFGGRRSITIPQLGIATAPLET